MSDDRSRRGSSPAESERLDDVIDDIGRQMTEGAAPNDLRARVLARLTTIPESRSANPSRAPRLWTLAPIAGAALIIVAVLVVRDRGPRFDRLPRTHARQESASPIARAQQTKPLEPSVQAAPGAVARGNHRPTKAGRASGHPSVSEVEALAPAPIETASLDVDAMTTDSIAIPPLETVAPIPVAPLATPEGERP